MLLCVLRCYYVSTGVSCDIAGDLLDIFLGNTLSLFGETVVSPADVNMYLFTRENPSLPVVITSDNAPLLNDGKPVKIIIHGWQNNGSSDWMNEMRTAYLMKGDYNVVQVDWGTIATQLYSTAADGTRGVGSIVAGVIISSEAPFENIHIIGHSLGAQVAGFIGRTMKGSSGQLIDRITGLDPARPLFEDIPTETSLSKTDAVMVDIIHTDGGKLGIISAAGTVDFYPNGGIAPQPGCLQINVSGITSLKSDLVVAGDYPQPTHPVG